MHLRPFSTGYLRVHMQSRFNLLKKRDIPHGPEKVALFSFLSYVTVYIQTHQNRNNNALFKSKQIDCNNFSYEKNASLSFFIWTQFFDANFLQKSVLILFEESKNSTKITVVC